MNFIVGMLLLYMNEEEVFWVMVTLLEGMQIGGVYLEGLPLLHQAFYERILSEHKNSLFVIHKWKSVKDTNPSYLYAIFMSILFSLLDCLANNAKFEGDCQVIIGM